MAKKNSSPKAETVEKFLLSCIPAHGAKIMQGPAADALRAEIAGLLAQLQEPEAPAADAEPAE